MSGLGKQTGERGFGQSVSGLFWSVNSAVVLNPTSGPCIKWYESDVSAAKRKYTLTMKTVKYITILSSCLLATSLALVTAMIVKADALTSGFQPNALLGGTDPVFTDTVTVTLTPGITTSLVYTYTQGHTTSLDFPGNAATQITTITLVPELMTAPRPDFISGELAFVLFAYRNGTLNKGFVFSAPVTITVHYSDSIETMADENLFSLYWWSGDVWQIAAQTCDPMSPYAQDEINNTIITAICYPGQFGLFGTHRVYLPLVIRAIP